MLRSLLRVTLHGTRTLLTRNADRWNEAMNTKLVKGMKKDAGKKVDSEEFIQCYNKALPSNMPEFAGFLTDFHAVAMSKERIAVGALELLAAKTEDAESRALENWIRKKAIQERLCLTLMRHVMNQWTTLAIRHMLRVWKENMDHHGQQTVTTTKHIIIDRLGVAEASNTELQEQVRKLQLENEELQDHFTATETEQLEARQALLVMLFRHLDHTSCGMICKADLEECFGSTDDRVKAVLDECFSSTDDQAQPTTPRRSAALQTLPQLLTGMESDAQGKVVCEAFVKHLSKHWPDAIEPFSWLVSEFGSTVFRGAHRKHQAELQKLVEERDEAESSQNAQLAQVESKLLDVLKELRRSQLARVFAEFDLDGSGTIAASELMQLGKMRRELRGQGSGEWSEEKNARLLKKMDSNGDGEISESEFSEHFEQALPQESHEFGVVVDQFMYAAKLCRERRQQENHAQMNKTEDQLSDSAQVRDELKLKRQAIQGLEAKYDLLNREHGFCAKRITEQAEKMKSLIKELRRSQLGHVFAEFDLDGSGTIEASELMLLGQARRKSGQRAGEWTESMNQKMMDRMALRVNDQVSADEFVAFFDQTLTSDATEFENTVQQFLAVATKCKTAPHKSAKHSTSPALQNKRRDGIAESFAEQELASPPRSSSPASDRSRARKKKLNKVFAEFDLDGAGTIAASELMQLGKMRRRLGQGSGEWSEEKNARLLKKMDSNGDGEISESEFSEHFEQALPQESHEFGVVVDQFMYVAKLCRERKQKLQDKVIPTTVSVNRQLNATTTSQKLQKDHLNGSRVGKLKKVFKEFDLDGTGFIGRSDLLQLGKARRSLGRQGGGGWTEEDHTRLVDKIDPNLEGKISSTDFEERFGHSLPKESLEFNKIIEQFMDVAIECRHRKAQRKSRQSGSSPSDLKSKKESSNGMESRLDMLMGKNTSR